MDELVDRIYEAAVIPELWPALFAEISGMIGARGGLLFAASVKSSRWVASPGFDAIVADYFAREFQLVDDRTRRLFALDHPGFAVDLDVFSEEEWRRDPIRQEFWAPAGLGWGAATAISVPTGDTLILHMENADARGPFTRASVDFLDGLRPHLARAALVSARLAMRRAEGAMEAMAGLGLPAAIVGPQGRFFLMNDLFEGLVPSIFLDRRRGLQLADPVADGLLQAALIECGDTGGTAPRSLPLAARHGVPPMIVHVVPIRGEAHEIFAISGVMIVATPVVTSDVPSARLLQGLFDLTPSEAKVARALASGQTIDTIVNAHGVARATVKNQTRDIFSKTGMGRQADLVGLLRGMMIPK